MAYKNCVIFGGTGFIGRHLATYLLNEVGVDNIYLADIKPLPEDSPLQGRVVYIECDVRKKITTNRLPQETELIANFAAIHREPGHENHEYYETNIPGAENVCEYASKTACKSLIFTSSIAPYGPSEQEKNELSIPTPISGYGGSKLVAEKIHIAWQKEDISRNLIIVRPGVVFGPEEGGNVTRLARATIRGYFFYMGNRKTRKAGGYVKELVRTMIWALNQNAEKKQPFLYNFAFPKPPSVEDYVNAVKEISGTRRRTLNIPHHTLLAASYVIDFFAQLLKINHPISPVRIRKLIRSNNIIPQNLIDSGYTYKHSFHEAMKDWYSERKSDWH